MLHLWLIPVLAIFVIAVAILYAVVKRQSGRGERMDGRTVTDKPVEPGPASSRWNVYDK